MNSLKEVMVINLNEIMIGNSWINYFPYITNEVDFSPTSDLIMVNEENWFIFFFLILDRDPVTFWERKTHSHIWTNTLTPLSDRE